jgi:hypothetical protein
MSERPQKPPHRSEQGRAERETRRARLAEALRANLRKRKTQARDRAAVDGNAATAAKSPGAKP